eukprot:1609370-Pyramimonas_sp.AAC.1
MDTRAPFRGQAVRLGPDEPKYVIEVDTRDEPATKTQIDTAPQFQPGVTAAPPRADDAPPLAQSQAPPLGQELRP